MMRAWSRDEHGKLIMRNGMEVYSEDYGVVRLIEVDQGPGLNVSRVADENGTEMDVYADTLRTLTNEES